MGSIGHVYRISISKSKGEKKSNVKKARLLENFGIMDDAHGGSSRQVSLLPYESFKKVRSELLDINPGDFAENITTADLNYKGIKIGHRLLIGDHVQLVVTAIGKECHNGCHIKEIVGDCIMPKEGVFARVTRGGTITVGDKIKLIAEES